MSSQMVVETDRLSKRYGRKTAVSELCLRVPQGSVYGFLGRNGAGKTTTIQMLMGLLQPSSGTAHVLGLDPVKEYVEVHRRVTYMPEHPSLYGWMTVGQTCDFASKLWPTWNAGRCEELLDRFELSRADRVSSLSRGMKGKVQLVLALAPEPELLLLDDPTAGLDAVVRREFMEGIIGALTDTGATVLFSSHIIQDVERMADHIGIIDNGRLLVQAPLDELKGWVVRVALSGNGAVLPGGIGEVLSEEHTGHERVLTVRGYSEDGARKLREAGIRVEVSTPSLEDIFVAYVGGHRG